MADLATSHATLDHTGLTGVGAGGGGFRGIFLSDAGNSNDTVTASGGFVNPISMSHVVLDTDSFYTSSGIITIPVATGHGLYRVTLQGMLTSSGTPTSGVCYVDLLPSGGPWDVAQEFYPTGVALDPSGSSNVLLTAVWEMTTGNTIRAYVQNGFDVNVRAEHGVTQVWGLTVEFLGAI